MIGALLVTALCIAVHAWQDGIHHGSDGVRYCSGKPQPSPFHRRWCGWPKRLLQVTTYACLLAIGGMMKDWKHALLLGTLPGFWLIATHPTTVDAPSMCLGLVAGLLFPTQPYGAVLLACVAGFIHERGPVFAALYAWNPLLLVGLVCVGWWRKPARGDGDPLVGQGLLGVALAHRPYVDLLDMRLHALSLRGAWLGCVWFGCSVQQAATLAVAMLSRLVGTDGCRFMFWAAPVAIRELPDLPVWMLAAHVATFRRAI